MFQWTQCRILVCGGRAYKGRDVVFATLDAIHEVQGISCIISGGASGADTFAEDWADTNNIPKIILHAEWLKYGRHKAGHIRNQRMMDEGKPDRVVAFPGGPGTADMIRIAKRSGVSVLVVSE